MALSMSFVVSIFAACIFLDRVCLYLVQSVVCDLNCDLKGYAVMLIWKTIGKWSECSSCVT